MANKGRQYAEDLVGALDRSFYNQQRDVAQNTYNTNWQNVQNQYKNLQDKLKLQQEKANKDFAEGLVGVAENSFNRQRIGSGNLANRGLSASGLTNILSQADTAQKGEEIGNLLKNAGAISADTADRLSQATSKYAQETTGLMGKLANTLGNIGDAETAAQNRYNNVLAGIAGAMDEREANNALQAAQRAASRASSGASSAQKKAQNDLEEFYKRVAISEVLSSPEMTDQQKANYLGIIFGIDNAGKAVNAYNNNVNATDSYNNKLNSLQELADKEMAANKKAIDNYDRNQYLANNQNYLDKYVSTIGFTAPTAEQYLANQQYKDSPFYYDPSKTYPELNYGNQITLDKLKKQGITYEDLAALLYGNK